MVEEAGSGSGAATLAPRVARLRPDTAGVDATVELSRSLAHPLESAIPLRFRSGPQRPSRDVSLGSVGAT